MELLLGLDEAFSLKAGMVDPGLKLVQEIDHILFRHVERHALGLGHLLELDHGEIVKAEILFYISALVEFYQTGRGEGFLNQTKSKLKSKLNGLMKKRSIK